MYFLAQGTLQVFVTGGAPGSSRIAILRAGSVVGEPGLFGDGPRMANVEAMTACVVWALRGPRLEELAQRSPALALEMLRAAGGVLAVRMRANHAKQTAVRLDAAEGWRGQMPFEDTSVNSAARRRAASASRAARAGRRSRRPRSPWRPAAPAVACRPSSCRRWRSGRRSAPRARRAAPRRCASPPWPSRIPARRSPPPW